MNKSMASHYCYIFNKYYNILIIQLPEWTKLDQNRASMKFWVDGITK